MDSIRTNQSIRASLINKTLENFFSLKKQNCTLWCSLLLWLWWSSKDIKEVTATSSSLLLLLLLGCGCLTGKGGRSPKVNKLRRLVAFPGCVRWRLKWWNYDSLWRLFCFSTAGQWVSKSNTLPTMTTGSQECSTECSPENLQASSGVVTNTTRIPYPGHHPKPTKNVYLLSYNVCTYPCEAILCSSPTSSL